MGITESISTQPSSHQIRLPQDSEYSYDRVIFLPIPDTTVRLANLQSGDLDMLKRLPPSDLAAVKGDTNLVAAEEKSFGYQAIYVNINNGDRAKNPLGTDMRVRQALSYTIDRDVVNQVVHHTNCQ